MRTLWLRKRFIRRWSARGCGLTTIIWGWIVKIPKEQMLEARSLYEKGVDIWSLSEAFGVHYDTMRKYLRQFDLYGESIYGPNPQYVEKEED